MLLIDNQSHRVLFGHGEHEPVGHPDHSSIAAIKSHQPDTQWVAVVVFVLFLFSCSVGIRDADHVYTIFPLFFFANRHEDIGDAVTGYAADAGQRPVALLLCLFHLWHRRRPTVGRHSAPEVLPRLAKGHQPAGHFVSFTISLLILTVGSFVLYNMKTSHITQQTC